MIHKLWQERKVWFPLFVWLLILAGQLAAAPGNETISVQEALRDLDRDGVPDRLGETVTLKGVLTSDPLLARGIVHGLAHLQDESAGIRLRAPDGVLLTAALERGDTAEVLGRIGQRNGQIELEVEQVREISNGSVPMPRKVMAAELLRGQHEGELVRLSGQLLVPSNPETDREGFQLRDESGFIQVYVPSRFFRNPEFAERLRKAESVELVGIVEQHTGVSAKDSGYGIRPRDPGDFRFISSVSHKTIALVGLAALILGVILHFYLQKRAAEKQAREIASFADNLRHSEAALRESNQKLTTLVKSSPLVIVALDAQGNVQTWNPAAEHMFGWSEQEVLGQPLPIVPEEARHQYGERQARLSQGKVIVAQEMKQRKDGSRFLAMVFISPIYDAAGQISGSMAIMEDIPLRTKAEEALRASEERYRDLFENANDIVCTRDLNGNFTSLNRAGETILGYSREEILGMNITQLAAPEYADLARRVITENLAGRNHPPYEVEAVTKDGRRVALEGNGRLMYEDGKPVGVQAILRDVTERKKLQSQLLHAQKMEAIGRLAGGVAHDFNNLLNVILGYSELLLDHVKKDAPLAGYTEEIRKAADRAAGLTRQLLAFSRKQVLEPKVLDLNGVIRDLETMLPRLIGEDIELTTILPAGLGRVKADPGQIEQVLMNLAVNSRDAMPQGGSLTIETANVELPENFACPERRRRVRPQMDVPPGSYVKIAVSDTGAGMDAETRAHLFEPFFTTKPRGKGTGLGLATVYGIVKQSGGCLSVSSKPGRGATFTIYLPRTDVAAEPSAPAKSQAAVPRGSGTILVVEDEPSLRELAREFLEHSGYRVLDADSGAAALELVQRYAGQIDLLLTDVIMPGMNGRRLAEEVAAIRPDLKVLYMSGYTDDQIGDQGVLEAGAHFLQKPFTRPALATKVRELLVS